MQIRVFEPRDEAAVIALWQAAGLTRPWNHPVRDVARKLAIQPALFFVGEIIEAQTVQLVATAMAGYDGHRGWISYHALLTDFRHAPSFADLTPAWLAMGPPRGN